MRQRKKVLECLNQVEGAVEAQKGTTIKTNYRRRIITEN